MGIPKKVIAATDIILHVGHLTSMICVGRTVCSKCHFAKQ